MSQMIPLVKISGLNKFFNKNKSNQLHVLNQMTLDLPSQGLVMLLGPSGSGKTTLLNVLGGLDKFDKGHLYMFDKNISKYQSKVWDHIRNNHIGYIFQNYHLLPDLSVFDNVAYVLKLMGITDEALIESRVHYVLKAVNMYAFRKKNALQISGGQQQRVAIARAIVKNPDMIIADEPTGNLDSQNTIEVMNIIKSIAKDKLVIMVTHEKEIASFYGDRIIKISDGKIVSDEDTHERGDYQMKYDETIYLGDLKKETLETTSNQTVDIYSEQRDKKLQATFIVKNDTIYIKVDSDLKKVKLLDDFSTIQIKEGKKEIHQKKTMSETSFDNEFLSLEHVEKKEHLMFSFKKAVFMALEKILRTSKKGKIMLVSFMLAGAVIAFAATSLSSVLFMSPDQYLTLPKGYVEVSLVNPEEETQDFPTLQQLKAIEGLEYVNTYNRSRIQLNFLSPSGINYNNASIFGAIDLYELHDLDLIYGKLPTESNEILITKVMVDALVDSAAGQDIGIWSYEHILFETLYFQGLEIKITGIVDAEYQVIFTNQDLADFLTYSYTQRMSLIWFDETTLLYGSLPKANQVLVPSSIGNFNANTAFPLVMEGITISGVYDAKDVIPYIFVTKETLENQRFESSVRYFILSSNFNETNQVLMNYDVMVLDLLENAQRLIERERQIALVSTLTTSLVVIGFAGLGFYFVIRSSLVKRQYEIAIMRAIGVYKKDIMRAFVVEILILTTITTLVGYGIATYGFSLLSNSFLGELNLFNVTFLSVIGGIVVAYVSNLLAGLLPVWLLLNKTPAQILSKYDM
jgi:putative ABC transport system permease protein